MKVHFCSCLLSVLFFHSIMHFLFDCSFFLLFFFWNTDGSLSEQILSTSAFIRLVKSVKTSHQLLLYKDINIYNTQKKLIKQFG